MTVAFTAPCINISTTTNYYYYYYYYACAYRICVPGVFLSGGVIVQGFMFQESFSALVDSVDNLT